MMKLKICCGIFLDNVFFIFQSHFTILYVESGFILRVNIILRILLTVAAAFVNEASPK